MERQPFDDLTEILASRVSRGMVLKTIVAASLSGMAALSGATAVGARVDEPSGKQRSCKCRYPDTCSNGDFQACSFSCSNSKFSSSYCFTGLPKGRKGTKRQLWCGVNSYCSKLQVCSVNSPTCPQGHACIVANGCNCSFTSSVCIQLCDKDCINGSSPRSSAPRGTAAGKP